MISKVDAFHEYLKEPEDPLNLAEKLKIGHINPIFINSLAEGFALFKNNSTNHLLKAKEKSNSNKIRRNAVKKLGYDEI